MRICYLINVYRDFEAARRLLDQLLSYAGGTEIIFLTDGTHDPEFGEICADCGIAYITASTRLKSIAGGAWTARFLGIYRQVSTAPYLIKLDPDSRMWRSPDLSTIPAADWFGTVHSSGSAPPFVAGGCLGFRREAVDRILDSGLLAAERYRDRVYSIEWKGERLSFSDQILSSVCHRLRLVAAPWAECFVLHRCEPSNPALKFAITHPHK